MTTKEPPAAIDTALGRVIIGYRIVGAIWLAILGVITLADSRSPDRPLIVVATILGVAGFALLTAWVYNRDVALLRTWWWLVLDVGVTIWTLYSSDVAGTSSTFYGGYPMSTVFVGVFTFAITGGLAAAAALSIATFFRQIAIDGSDPTTDSAAVLIYLFGGLLAGWAVGVIRRSDRLRRQAEQALAAERASRARIEERAEMAAHLHDSVLQTLALIQRTEKPEETAALARRQERELREWLFGDGATPDESFSAAVRSMAAGIEEMYPVRVQTVVVGDAPLDDGLDAMVKAGREASINAARHAGVDEFSIYAEVGSDSVGLYVRDRGGGFDVGSVPSDRRGIVESIQARMERHGGSARIRSAPGDGTEVILEREVET
jgi:signal transduction histidine kinase